MAISQLAQGQLSKSFWELAIVNANYIYNRTATAKTGAMTPYELFFKKKPRVDHMRVFGCKSFYHLKKPQRKSDLIPAKIGRFVGYSSNGLLYKIWTGRKIIETRHVTFDEKSFIFRYGDETTVEETPWIKVDPMLLQPSNSKQKPKTVTWSTDLQQVDEETPARVPTQTPVASLSAMVSTYSQALSSQANNVQESTAQIPFSLDVENSGSTQTSENQISHSSGRDSTEVFVDAMEDLPVQRNSKNKGLDGPKWLG